jgi:hypothetical protein
LARGLFALADAHGIELVGGDTTAGPLNLCITVFGQVPAGQALLRSGARPGDDLWVSGTLGDARLALEVFRGRARAGPATPSSPCGGDGAAPAARGPGPGAARHGQQRDRLSATACSATWATCCALRRRRRVELSTPCRAAPCWPRSPGLQRECLLRRRRRLRAAVHRRAPRAAVQARRGAPAWPSRASAASTPAPGLRGDGRTPAAAQCAARGFDHFA